MARWTGSSERFICLWDKVNGGEGNWVARGKKDRWIKRRCNLKCYKEKRHAEKCFPLVWMCMCFISCWSVHWYTAPARGLSNSPSKQLTGLAGPKGVKVNKAHFLPEKKLSYNLDFSDWTFSDRLDKWNWLTQRKNYTYFIYMYLYIHRYIYTYTHMYIKDIGVKLTCVQIPTLLLSV